MNRLDLLRVARQAAAAVPAVIGHIRPDVHAALKAASDMGTINSVYHDAITSALIIYFEGGNLTAQRNIWKRACVVAFTDAFSLGYQDGGGGETLDEEENAWLDARINTEFGYINSVFVQAKEIKAEEGADYFAWATERADGYTGALPSAYNQGMLFASKNQMLTFDGEDGDANHICQSINGTCVRLKGQRHKASWWIAHDLMPYPGNKNFDCGGWRCRHFLRDDDGNRITL